MTGFESASRKMTDPRTEPTLIDLLQMWAAADEGRGGSPDLYMPRDPDWLQARCRLVSAAALREAPVPAALRAEPSRERELLLSAVEVALETPGFIRGREQLQKALALYRGARHRNHYFPPSDPEPRRCVYCGAALFDDGPCAPREEPRAPVGHVDPAALHQAIVDFRAESIGGASPPPAPSGELTALREFYDAFVEFSAQARILKNAVYASKPKGMASVEITAAFRSSKERFEAAKVALAAGAATPQQEEGSR